MPYEQAYEPGFEDMRGVCRRWVRSSASPASCRRRPCPQILDRVIEDMKKNGSAQWVRAAAKMSGPRQQPGAIA